MEKKEESGIINECFLIGVKIMKDIAKEEQAERVTQKNLCFLG